MKTIWLIIFVIIVSFTSSIGFPQSLDSYRGAISQLYLDKQPDPKSEGMGRGLVANNESDFGSYYNPALTSLGSGVNFNYSHTFLFIKETHYNYYSIGYSNKKLGAFSFSDYSWENIIITRQTRKYTNSISTLNYSRELFQNFYAGVNLEFVHMGYLRNYNGRTYSPEWENGFIQNPSDAVTLDIGVLKKFNMESSSDKSVKKTFELGAAIYNFADQKISDNNYKDVYERLPVILRGGISFTINVTDGSSSINSSQFQSFSHFEFENVLNDDGPSVFKVGEELILSNFLILRCGIVDKGRYEYSNELSKTEFTFGAGFKAGFNKFLTSKDQLTFILDYSGMPPTTKLTNIANDFILWSLKVNYIP